MGKSKLVTETFNNGFGDTTITKPRYKVKISSPLYKGKLKTSFTTSGEVKLYDLLLCLQLDISTMVNYPDPIDFIEEFGCDIREGLKIYQACQKLHNNIYNWAGSYFLEKLLEIEE